MAACYAPDIQFSDPVFGVLRGREASDMWRMLLSRATDFSLTFSDIQTSARPRRAKCVATYRFSQTGRKVVNRISVAFRDPRWPDCRTYTTASISGPGAARRSDSRAGCSAGRRSCRTRSARRRARVFAALPAAGRVMTRIESPSGQRRLSRRRMARSRWLRWFRIGHGRHDAHAPLSRAAAHAPRSRRRAAWCSSTAWRRGSRTDGAARIPLTMQRYGAGSCSIRTRRRACFPSIPTPWPTWRFQLGDRALLTAELFVAKAEPRRRCCAGGLRARRALAATLKVRPLLSGPRLSRAASRKSRVQFRRPHRRRPVRLATLWRLAGDRRGDERLLFARARLVSQLLLRPRARTRPRLQRRPRHARRLFVRSIAWRSGAVLSANEGATTTARDHREAARRHRTTRRAALGSTPRIVPPMPTSSRETKAARSSPVSHGSPTGAATRSSRCAAC